MDYRELFCEENESVRERYDLAVERIREMKEETEVSGVFGEYFRRTAAFFLMLDEVVKRKENHTWELLS